MERILSEQSRVRIAEQARQSLVRAQRQDDGSRTARKEALALAPHIRALGENVGDKSNRLVDVLAAHIANQSPISLVGFWGEGGKEAPDQYDFRLMEYLQSLAEGISTHYHPGAHLTEILADLHGVFNGFRLAEDPISPYLQAIARQLETRGATCVWLSDLYQRHYLHLPDISYPVKIHSEADRVFEKHRRQYLHSAGLHHRTGVGPKEAGYHYVAMRLSERAMLTREFPNSILLINGNKLSSEPLLPHEMPILYLTIGPVWFKKEG